MWCCSLTAYVPCLLSVFSGSSFLVWSLMGCAALFMFYEMKLRPNYWSALSNKHQVRGLSSNVKSINQDGPHTRTWRKKRRKKMEWPSFAVLPSYAKIWSIPAKRYIPVILGFSAICIENNLKVNFHNGWKFYISQNI